MADRYLRVDTWVASGLLGQSCRYFQLMPRWGDSGGGGGARRRAAACPMLRMDDRPWSLNGLSKCPGPHEAQAPDPARATRPAAQGGQ